MPILPCLPVPEQVNCPDELVTILASLHAALTEDAAFHRNVEYGIAAVNGFALPTIPAQLTDAVPVGGYGKFLVVLVAVCAAGRKHCQRKFQARPYA